VASKGLIGDYVVDERQHEWEEAARRMPHGKTIELDRG
jgi:hypothetical protein